MKVEIAGAGIIGLSIAWRLAQRGIEVVVRDASVLAGESSWAGAGMLAPGGEFRSDTPWARRAVESLAAFGPFVEELTGASGVPIDYQVCGAIELAFGEREDAALQAAVRRQRELGIRSEPVDLITARTMAPIPSKGPTSAVWYPDEAIVDPRTVCEALVKACERLGVALRPHDAVHVPAEPAVIAAGAWSSMLEVPEAAPEAYPVKGHLIGYHLRPGSLRHIVRRGHHYALQRANGLTIFGSDEWPHTWDRGVDAGSVRALSDAAMGLLPDLLYREPDEAWVGFRPGSGTGAPVMERVAGRDLWLAYGHYRNGILLAPLTAEWIAHSISASFQKG
jgi:glycine oxidase